MMNLSSLKKKFFNPVFLIIAVPLLLFFLLEGFADTVLLWKFTPPNLSGYWPEDLKLEKYTQYDALLGWISRRNVTAKDFYGTGVYLKTNAQQFRAENDVLDKVPAGKMRMICSGGSSVFGPGITNAQTWSRRLEKMDPRLECVNMGQAGYGTDQAYLWYKRDGITLDHTICLFCLGTGDLLRMRDKISDGHAKPRLVIFNNKLFLTNVPVPKSYFWGSRWLAVITGATGIGKDLFGNRRAETGAGSPEDLAHYIIQDLGQISHAAGRQCLSVYIPSAKYDYSDLSSEPLVNAWKDCCQKNGIRFVDLREDLRREFSSKEQAEKLFLPGSGECLNAAGNQKVADFIYQKLKALKVLG